MVIHPSKVCVYCHKSKGKMFYIGMGDHYRPYSKEHRNPVWREIIEREGEYDVEILAEFPSRKEAQIEERRLIKLHRPEANLDLRILPMSNSTINIRNVPIEQAKRFKLAAIERGLSLKEFMLDSLEKVIGGNGRLEVAESLSADVGSASPKGRRGSPTKNESNVELRDGESDAPARPLKLADEIAKIAKPMQEKPKANSSILENVDLKSKPWCAPDSETRRHLIAFVDARGREPENIPEWEYFNKHG